MSVLPPSNATVIGIDVQDIVHWCRERIGASVIALDTPCRWSTTGRMLRGATLVQALETSHPLLTTLSGTESHGCFETFPHAITWHLRAGNAQARQKRPQRLALLRQAGIDTTSLTSIDWIDAALCALAAHHLASGRPCQAYGEPASGLIVVPQPAT